MLVTLSVAKDLCNLLAVSMLSAKCIGPSTRKKRAPQDDNVVRDLDGVECLIQIFEDVVCVFDSYRNSH